MKKSLLLGAFALLAAAACVTQGVAADWKPVDGILLSKFAKDVDPAQPLPEYPRPQMVRADWVNLNGLWDYAILPVGEKFEATQGEILVPFCAESALGGVGKTVGKENNLWYKKTFEIPKEWAGKSVLLNFGAVDWRCDVWLNDVKVGSHQGGYCPFTVDLTAALKPEGKQILIVKVWDPTNDGVQAIGKQIKNPHGIWYTPVTGIWQTVWMEPVAKAHITKVRPVSDIDDMTVAVFVEAEDAEGATVAIGDKTAKVVSGKATITLDVKGQELWTPDNPKLYDFSVTLAKGGETVDKVDSYYANRKTSLGKTPDGITRMMLNNEFVFQHGPLDQGWWPDGLYTPPTDAGMRYDIEVLKSFGFNMLRKHIKVEPARYYYACDQLGMLVWQDMPSGDTAHYIRPSDPDAERSPESVSYYETELRQMFYSLDFFPCIVMWVPFNEGWGQFDTPRIVALCRTLDPTRLVDCTSGWSDRPCGDVHDMHNYPGPGMFPPEDNRATVLGEYGGLGLPVKGHSWKEDGNWGYVKFEDQNALFARYNALNRAMRPLITKGLSAAVYTQTTDVEIEVNGFMSYDREVIKFPVDKMRKSNEALRGPEMKTEIVIGCSRNEAKVWKYTFDKPADAWNAADFDDSAWKEGEGGFGTKGTPGAVVRTTWDGSDIWIRRAVELTADQIANPEDMLAYVYHDEDAEVYINGVKIAEFTGYQEYYYADVDVEALKSALKEGKNVVAVHCHQSTGGQYIDFGLVKEVPAK
ncbi:MAG: glycoside hydrolase family 2 [Thermoguttaceae bacterium]|nr:glycoside hydrolase family 2 [Thermoguttaceae bacterium]